MTTARIRFGEFEADLRTEELRRSGRVVRLPNQSFRVLAMLLRSPGQLVTREELRRHLWPRDTFIEYEQALNAAVNRLRETLGDSAGQPRYVETLPRRGYRFVGTIEPEVASQPQTATPAAELKTAATKPGSAPGSSRGRRWALPLLAVLAVLALIVVALRFPRDEPLELRLVPFTSLPNREISPSFSPDGNQIAFAWDGDENSAPGFDLYIKGTDNEKMLRLTERPAQWMAVAWSHDGRQIAFARTADADTGIFLVPALGGQERLLFAGKIESDLTQLAWSADDRELVYSAYGPSGRQVLYRLPLDSPTPQLLQPPVHCADMGNAAVAPDGRRIAFVCTSSFAVYAIHTMNMDGSEVRKLADLKGSPEGIVWAADGSHIVFANDAGDGGSLWRVSLDRKVERFAFGEEGWTPAVAAHGNRVAYSRVREVVDIWRIDLQSPAPENSATRLISSTRMQMLPQYSPDGARIAFQSNRTGSWEIWVADADGTNPLRVTSINGALTGAVSWCADSRRVAFDSRASGLSAVYVADIHERLPRVVQTNVANLALPVWSPDCQWLIANDGNPGSWLVPVAGGTARRFTQQRSYLTSMAGERVIFNVGVEEGVALWQKRIDSDAEQPLAGFPIIEYSDSWTATDRGVYFMRAADDPRLVRFYDFATRQIRPVVRLANAPKPAGGMGLSISPDQRWLLYSQIEDRQSDIMLLTQSPQPGS